MTNTSPDEPELSQIAKNFEGLRSSDFWQKLQDERAVTIDPTKVFKYRTMYDTSKEKNLNSYKNQVLRGIYDQTLLSDLFFSEENIWNLDNQLRYKIYEMSEKQFILGPQDKVELVLIMRAIFLNYSRNNPYCSVTDQIKKLNDLVIEKASTPLYSNTLQYLRYLEDANESHKMVIALPVNVNNKGTKVLGMGSALGF